MKNLPQFLVLLLVLGIAWAGYNHHPILGIALLIEGLKFKERNFVHG